VPRRRTIHNSLIAAAAVLCTGARLVPASERSHAPPPAAASDVQLELPPSAAPDTTRADTAARDLARDTRRAVATLAALVRPLSDPNALADAFKSYFAFRAAHPGEVRKPFLYFADYGLPSTRPRGYVFDMDALRIVDGPFAVAHGRGSSDARYGVSGDFNDNARERRVVAHGAPYVTATKAGRSEGCPAMEPARARRLLPKLPNGGLVFLFAPDSQWLAEDPWIAAGDA
jgi:hypothetical protein